MKNRSLLYACNAALAIFATACAHGPVEGAQGPYALRVSNSEKDLETALGKYFEKEKHWKVQYLVANNDPDDIYLGLIFKMDEGTPDLRLRIDSFASNQKKGLVVERRVLIETFLKLGITPDSPHYLEMLDWINRHSEKYWVPDQMFLDKDGDLALKSSQNIAGRDYNLHAEQVADMVVRLAMAWQDINKNMPDFAKQAAARANNGQAPAGAAISPAADGPVDMGPSPDPEPVAGPGAQGDSE